MTITTAVRARLAGFAGLTALVGGATSPRIYMAGDAPLNVPRPYVTYQKISAGERVDSFAGPSHLVSPRFQIDAWADNPGSADAVATQVRLALDGFVGTAGGVKITDSHLEDERDLPDEDTALRRASQDFTIWHEEPS